LKAWRLLLEACSELLETKDFLLRFVIPHLHLHHSPRSPPLLQYLDHLVVQRSADLNEAQVRFSIMMC
jgi:hypothetical protein